MERFGRFCYTGPVTGGLRQHFRDLVIRKKILLLLLALTLFITAAVAGGMYAVASRRRHQSLQSRLRHVAITTALLVVGEDVDRVRSESDRGGEAWKAKLEDLARQARAAQGLSAEARPTTRP